MSGGGGSRQIWVGLVLLAATASRSSLAEATAEDEAESFDGGTTNISGEEKKSEKFYDVDGYGNGFADYGSGYVHHGDAGIVRTQGKA